MQAELTQLPPAELLPPTTDLRDRTDLTYQEFFDRLRADIAERGIQQPVVVFRTPAGIAVGDGWTRVLAALMLRLKSVPVLLYPEPLDPGELRVAMTQANAMRRDLTDLEYARVYLELMPLKGWSKADVARGLNHKPAQVTKRLKVVSHLPADLAEAIGDGDGKIPFTAAYALARAFGKLGDVPPVRDLVEQVRKGLLKRDSVERAVARLLGGPTRREKPVKVRTPKGLLALIPAADSDAVVAELTLIIEAVKKASRFGLPLSSLPQLLRS